MFSSLASIRRQSTAYGLFCQLKQGDEKRSKADKPNEGSGQHGGFHRPVDRGQNTSGLAIALAALPAAAFAWQPGFQAFFITVPGLAGLSFRA
jgi:hypothetical protein